MDNDWATERILTLAGATDATRKRLGLKPKRRGFHLRVQGPLAACGCYLMCVAIGLAFWAAVIFAVVKIAHLAWTH